MASATRLEPLEPLPTPPPATPPAPAPAEAPSARPGAGLGHLLGARLGVWLAQAVLLLLSVGGALAFALQVASWPDHPLADMTHTTGWARNIQQEGIEAAYGGVYPESYLIYPPGMAHVYRAAVAFSERVAPPPALAGGDWLRYSMKLMPVLGHGALALALFLVVAPVGAGWGGRGGETRPGRAFWRGWTAATLYAWNPAALFDSAYWGQGDSLNTTCLVLAAGALVLFPSWWPVRTGGRWRLWAQVGAVAAGGVAGALLATGSLVKPQTWVFLPLLLWVALRRTGPLGIGALAGAAVVTAQALIRPWVEAGRLEEMLSVFANLPQVMPSVSANGHNLWWLKLPGVALAVFDSQPVGGFGEWAAPPLLTHATVGRLGFGLFALLPLLRLSGPLSPRLVLAGAAYTASAYFMTVTQVHENHQFAAIPLLAATAALDPFFVLPFLTVSLCSFLNMALHDFLVGDALAAALMARLPWQDPLALQTANATLNVAGFAIMTLLILRRPPGPPQSARALLWRARFVLLTGLVLALGALGALLAILRDPLLAARLWERLAAQALGSGPVEAHLKRQTAPEDLLARAAVELANLLYLLGGVAAIVGAVAAAAGLWWVGCAHYTRWRARYD
jgi:hypothetical protein